MEKGILTKVGENKIGSFIDDKVELPALWESIDGQVFKFTIGQLDDYFGEKINEPYKSTIREIGIQILEETNFNNAISLALTFIDSQVDIPGIDDATELAIFKGLEYIAFAILAKINTNGEA